MKKKLDFGAMQPTQPAITPNEQSFISSAQMGERANRNVGGRPPVEGEKADKAKHVYFTSTEQDQVNEFLKNRSFSGYIKELLREKGVIQ